MHDLHALRSDPFFFSIHLAHIGAGERLEQIDFLLDHHHCSPFEVGPWSGKDDEVSPKMDRKWNESGTKVVQLRFSSGTAAVKRGLVYKYRVYKYTSITRTTIGTPSVH